MQFNMPETHEEFILLTSIIFSSEPKTDFGLIQKLRDWGKYRGIIFF